MLSFFSKKVSFSLVFVLALNLAFHSAAAMEIEPNHNSSIENLEVTEERIDYYYAHPEEFRDKLFSDSADSTDSDWSSSADTSVEDENMPFVKHMPFVKQVFNKELEKGNQKAKVLSLYVMATSDKADISEWPAVYEWLLSQKDDPFAMHWLENFTSQHSPHDPDKTEKGYTKAAEEGDASSYRKLGNLYKCGCRGFQSNQNKAKECFEKGVEGKDPASFRKLGSLFRYGCKRLNFSKDSKKATFYYQKAEEMGDPIAKKINSRRNKPSNFEGWVQ